MGVQEIAYVELYVHDPRAAVDSFTSRLGFVETGRAVTTDRTRCFLQQGRGRIVVTAGSATCGFLDEHGDGIADIIQRRGSRGFGSANIRALYDAVERDRLTAG